MLQVTFPEIVRVLESLSSSLSAAEGHGCLCGALCTSAHYPLERWLAEIVPDDAPADAAPDQALQLLFEDTVHALRSDQMEFQPLLPDDQETLERRAQALSQWCQGFLYGFGTGHPVKAEDMTNNVGEILRDMTHIGRAVTDLGEASEEEEQAYSDVVEYIRVGVQLVHDEPADAESERAAARLIPLPLTAIAVPHA